MGGGVGCKGVVFLSIAVLSAACGVATAPAAPAAPQSEPASTSPGTAPASPPSPPPSLTPWDPSSLDPRIDVTLTGAPSCAGVGPRSPVPPPVRIVRPSTTSCGSGGATSDALGDVAVACLDGRGDRGWNEIFSADGTQHTTIAAWGLAVPTDEGFAAAYRGFGARTARQSFVWFDGAAWQAWSDPDASAPMRGVSARPGKAVLEVAWTDSSGIGATTRWVDAHGTPLQPARAWPDAMTLNVAAIDAVGRALVTYGTTAAPGIFARWLQPDDTAGPEMPIPGSDAWEPLAGGGLLYARTSVLRSGATALEPAPSWLASRSEPMAIVNGGRAYAFVSDTTDASQCVATVALVATDGTACGAVTLTSPQASCPQHTSIGPDGTVIQLVPTSQPDPGSVWRWWSGYLR